MFWRNLLSTSTTTVVAAVAGSLATASGVRTDWYEQLDKPDFQPPPEAFPIAWTLLYDDIALSSAGVLTELDGRTAAGSEPARRAAASTSSTAEATPYGARRQRRGT